MKNTLFEHIFIDYDGKHTSGMLEDRSQNVLICEKNKCDIICVRNMFYFGIGKKCVFLQIDSVDPPSKIQPRQRVFVHATKQRSFFGKLCPGISS